MEQRFLTDKALKAINAKEFRAKTGITKADYRFLRALILRGEDLNNITLLSPKENNEEVTLHQFCRKLRDIDVLYITRLQVERRKEGEDNGQGTYSKNC